MFYCYFYLLLLFLVLKTVFVLKKFQLDRHSDFAFATLCCTLIVLNFDICVNNLLDRSQSHE